MDRRRGGGGGGGGGWAGRRCLTSCPPMLISHGLNRQHKGEKEKDFDMRASNATHTNIESQQEREEARVLLMLRSRRIGLRY